MSSGRRDSGTLHYGVSSGVSCVDGCCSVAYGSCIVNSGGMASSSNTTTNNTTTTICNTTTTINTSRWLIVITIFK